MTQPLSSVKTAGIITIRNAHHMTPRGRKDVADWMRAQADFLEEYGGDYVATHMSRYVYDDAVAKKRKRKKKAKRY